MNTSKKHRIKTQMNIWQMNMRGHLTKQLFINSVKNNLTPYELNYLMSDDWMLFKDLQKYSHIVHR